MGKALVSARIAYISLVQCKIVVTTNFLFLRKLAFKFERDCEIMELPQN